MGESHSNSPLQRTPLYETHVRLGGRMVGFGGWEMPVQYTGILDEHLAVRQAAGLFDISHMGEVIVTGPGAESVLNQLLTNDVRRLAVGQAQYTLMCHERGGVIDDLIVYRLEQARYLLVINASHIPRDFEWMTSHSAAGCQWENVSNQTAGFAVQGPSAKQILTAAADLAGFHFRELPLANSDCWVARTGYTGEDGFEIFCPATDAVRVWDALLEMGRNFGLKPCGLGARDTLRLEMCYPLHGNDISESTTPIEAGLSRYVFFDKGAFIGREVLAAQRESGPSRKLVAFKMRDKSPPPRQHYPVTANGRVVGEVTSGTQSPSLGIGIGMAYVESGVAKAGSQIEIEVRGKPFAAVIETKPLLKKTK